MLKVEISSIKLLSFQKKGPSTHILLTSLISKMTKCLFNPLKELKELKLLYVCRKWRGELKMERLPLIGYFNIALEIKI